MKPILYTSPGSHHSRRVTILVHELGIDVELEPIDVRPPGLGGDNHSESFHALNPNEKVPVLRDGDFLLWESSAIMWYLAERHGDTPLWPRDGRRRADIAKWQLWQAAHLSPAADGLMYERMVRPMLGQTADAAHLAALTTSFHRWCDVLDGALARTPMLTGPDFTCADIAVATALMWSAPVGMPLERHAPVVDWLARVHARPSWQATQPAIPAR
jgi:glutathione S-transferase